MSVSRKDAWTPQEDSKMERLFNDGVPVAKIAIMLGRTYNSVASRRKRLSNLPVANIVTKDKKKVETPKSSKLVKDLVKIANKSKKITIPASNVVNVETTKTPRDNAKDLTKVARTIARKNGKRITMAMFFVEDL
jgi:hypothetical protein